MPLCISLLLLGALPLGSVALGQAEGGAVDTLGEAAAPADPQAPSGGGPKAWTAYVPRGVVPVAASTEGPASAPSGGGGDPLLLGLVAFLLAGVAGAAGYYAAKARVGDEVTRQLANLKLPRPQAPLPAPSAPAAPALPIQLRGAERIEGYGSLLILEADGEFFAVFVAEDLSAATLLCRLSEPPAMGWRLEEIVASVVAAIRHGGPGEAARAMAQALPREAGPRPEVLGAGPGQDEDLDVLLDELLGKVRGMKPTGKGDNEL